MKKEKFNSELNLGSIKRIEEFERKKIEIEMFSKYIDFEAKRKLKFNLEDDAKKVAIKVKKEFDKVELKLKEKKLLKSSNDDKVFLENLIRIIEEFNIFVFEFIDKKKKEELILRFNGFFMSPNLIVIKRQQNYFKQEIFTLMREFAHYLIEEEIDNKVGEDIFDNSNIVENWCNDFAYYFLVGDFDSKLKELSKATEKNNFHKDLIEEITKKTHISNFALYTRLKINNQISDLNYNIIYGKILDRINKENKKRQFELELKKAKAKALGKDFFIPSAKPIESKLYKNLIKQNYFEGNIAESRVLESLDVKNKSFDEVIYS